MKYIISKSFGCKTAKFRKSCGGYQLVKELRTKSPKHWDGIWSHCNWRWLRSSQPLNLRQGHCGPNSWCWCWSKRQRGLLVAQEAARAAQHLTVRAARHCFSSKLRWESPFSQSSVQIDVFSRSYAANCRVSQSYATNWTMCVIFPGVTVQIIVFLKATVQTLGFSWSYGVNLHFS